jgi:hypothetical protein
MNVTSFCVAQFGVPLYGGALTGEIVYMENNKLGCNVFERPLIQASLPVFLLVERGGTCMLSKFFFLLIAKCILLSEMNGCANRQVAVMCLLEHTENCVLFACVLQTATLLRR